VEAVPGSDGKSVAKLNLAINTVKGDSVQQSDQIEEIETGLVLRSCLLATNQFKLIKTLYLMLRKE
jgi:hypothetical protein